MLFNSLQFAVFLPIVVVCHFLLPRQWRWVLLLVASYVFYMAWWPPYVVLLFASTLLDWWVGRSLPGAGTLATRRAWLALSLSGNLGILFSFKYYNLINETLAWLAGGVGLTWTLPDHAWLLPVGISFYTFQTMSYVIDVYRGKLAPEPNLARFALYVSFFPQLVAGPIERATSLLPQLRRPADLDWDRVASGLRLALWGLFKKVVVADRLAVLVNAVYAQPDEFGGFAYVVATAFFSTQVYCDFSGYSDIAIGVARIFGLELMANFDQPYGSRSMSEFWSRWHISLSSWFRDYLYFPLGGNRVAAPRWMFNTLLVFVVSGMWHGASWRFLVWGLAHGVLVIADSYTKPLRDRVATAFGLDQIPAVRSVIAIGSTQVLWMMTLVPFRANSTPDMVYILTHVTDGWQRIGQLDPLLMFLQRVHFDLPVFLWCLLLMPLVETVDHLRRDPVRATRWRLAPASARWTVDYLVLFSVLALGHWSDSPFVYFQF